MKSITRVKRVIQKQLTAKETYNLVEFCRELAYKKQKEEKITKIKTIGVGNQILIQGGSSLMVEQGLAGLIGTIVRYGPKRVRINLPNHPKRPGEWMIPYHYLYPVTEKNTKREQKLKKHAEMLVGSGTLKKLNKIVSEVL